MGDIVIVSYPAHLSRHASCMLDGILSQEKRVFGLHTEDFNYRWPPGVRVLNQVPTQDGLLSVVEAVPDGSTIGIHSLNGVDEEIAQELLSLTSSKNLTVYATFQESVLGVLPTWVMEKSNLILRVSILKE